MKATAPTLARRIGPIPAMPAVVALAVVVAGCIPLITDDQYVLAVLAQAGLFVMLGCGLNIVVSLAGLLDLGYIAFWAVGAYVAAVLASGQAPIAIPVLLVMPIAVVVTSIFAVVIGVPTLRVRGDYLAIVTLGFGEIVRISLINGGALTGGASGIQAIHRPSVLFYTFSYQVQPYYYLIFVLCLAALGIGYALRRSSIGLAWQALRDDELAARTAGLWPLRYYLMAFGVGAAFAGVSGVIFATLETTVAPDSFTVDQSFLVLAVVVLGGLSGKFWPVAVSAIAVIGLPELLRGLADYRLVVFGPILVVVVIAREWLPEVRRRWRGLSLIFGGFGGTRSNPSSADRSQAEFTRSDDDQDVEQTLNQRN